MPEQALAGTSLRISALATGAVFFASGAVFATWVSRLPTTRDRLDASTAELGLALLMPGLGSLVAMPVTGRLCNRFGSRAVVMATALPACAILVLLAFLPSIMTVGAALFVWGTAYGSWDVAMNVHGSAIERAAGRDWMPRYHAGWSVGGVAGAGLGVLAAKAGLGVSAHFIFGAAFLAAVVLLSLRLFADERSLVAADQRGGGDDGWPPVSEPDAVAPRLITFHLVLIGVVTLCATCIEGAAADWLALLLTDERDATDSVAAGGYAIFAVAMATSRFLGTPVIARLGRARAVRIAGVVTLVGVVATVLAPGVPGSYIGALLWGAGVALVFPAAMSAGGEVPGRAADAIAAASTIGYGGFLLGPPLIGVLAEHVGLDRALLVLSVLAAGIIALAPVVRSTTR